MEWRNQRCSLKPNCLIKNEWDMLICFIENWIKKFRFWQEINYVCLNVKGTYLNPKMKLITFKALPWFRYQDNLIKRFTSYVHVPDNLTWLKGTVSVISRNPSCKDDISRFSTLCLNKYELDINVFVSLNYLFSLVVSLRKGAHFLFLRSNEEK